MLIGGQKVPVMGSYFVKEINPADNVRFLLFLCLESWWWWFAEHQLGLCGSIYKFQLEMDGLGSQLATTEANSNWQSCAISELDQTAQSCIGFVSFLQ